MKTPVYVCKKCGLFARKEYKFVSDKGDAHCPTCNGIMKSEIKDLPKIPSNNIQQKLLMHGVHLTIKEEIEVTEYLKNKQGHTGINLPRNMQKNER